MSQAVEEIRARLFSLQDTEYQAFQSRLKIGRAHV